MRVIDRPSPNHNDRPDGRAPDMLVLHYTGMETAAAALDRLCNAETQVSAHYTVDEEGRVYAHVPEDRRAWHSGVSFWQGETDVNGASIGIEIVNPGHEFGYRPFSEAQMTSVLVLSRTLVERYGIRPLRVVGHSDVAPDRKTDPGELFDWPFLAGRGVGFWPEAEDVGRHLDATFTQKSDTIAQNFRKIGYDWPKAPSAQSEADKKSRAIVAAFQRHFRREAVTGKIDPETAALAAVVAKAPD